jgi:hypothetical protein
MREGVLGLGHGALVKWGVRETTRDVHGAWAGRQLGLSLTLCGLGRRRK